MSGIFSYAKLFRGDISTWDVSNVRDMSAMFMGAKDFNGDLSEWDVSRVTNMPDMFRNAKSFDGDISKWDVSSVRNMDHMFSSATSFKQRLCGASWVHSKASKTVMFAGSPGSISRTVCTSTPSAFSPKSKQELQSAITRYVVLSPNADCPHGPIGEWDVSSVTDMSKMFYRMPSFNKDISKWDVSRVKDMSAMFMGADAFNGDISKWDVSKVTTMNGMFEAHVSHA